VICEGYTDVMAFTLAGSPNAVATCGTALADDHFQILKNLARKVVLAYDSDAAGQSAAEKWYGWEQRYEIQLEVADLPAGKDPADVWREDPAALLRALERATPFLQFRLDRVLAAADVATLEGRARAAEAGADIVAQHPSDLVRDQYVMKLAGGLDIDADRMREAVSKAAARPRPQEPRPRSQSNEPPRDERAEPPRRIDRRETDLLRWAIHEPELVVDWLEPYLFTDPIARAAFEHIEASNIHDALAASEGQVRLLLERLAVEDVIVDDEPETLRARLMVNAVVPPAERVLARFVRADNPRASDLKVLLDALADSRAAGDWEAVQHNAIQLLGWVAVESRGANAV
jgi:DNA primase